LIEKPDHRIAYELHVLLSRGDGGHGMDALEKCAKGQKVQHGTVVIYILKT
jgi:hypothetical protein